MTIGLNIIVFSVNQEKLNFSVYNLLISINKPNGFYKKNFFLSSYMLVYVSTVS